MIKAEPVETQRMTHDEFLRRSVAHFELMDFAKSVHWPPIDIIYLDRALHIPAGERAWRDALLGSFPARRAAWIALEALEHQSIHTERIGQ